MTDELTEEIKNSETADEANLEAQPVPDATGEAAGESDEGCHRKKAGAHV